MTVEPKMQRAFVADCRWVMRQTEKAIPEGVALRDWQAFLRDLLVRMVFLRLASAGREKARITAGADSAPPLLQEVLAGAYSEEHPADRQPDPCGILLRLSPVGEVLRRAAGYAARATGPLQPLLGPESRLWHYRFSPNDGQDGALGPGVLATLVEQLGGDRRGRGVYYTPEPVVDTVCREVLALRVPALRSMLISGQEEPFPEEGRATVIKQLRALRILDPACGGGAFLVGMQRVVREVQRGLTTDDAISHLYGVELDPQAAAVTRMRLWLAAGNCQDPSGSIKALTANIVVGDSISAERCRPPEGKWDIVVTNPPYGVRVHADDRDRIMGPSPNGLQSRDSYGLFLAQIPEMLADGGVAGLVVADTWRTIKSHRALRERLLGRTTLVHVVDLPERTFAATVGAEVVVLVNRPASGRDTVRTADLRRSGDRGSTELRELLLNRKATERLPLYEYEQSLCNRHGNSPVFIAAPSLFERLLDPSLVRLGEIAEIRHGLTTGAVRRFVYTQHGVRGGFEWADPRMMVSGAELETLTEQERRDGFEAGRFDGRFLVPYDKGGGSEINRGWLPCYWTPTAYAIDWRRSTLEQMKQLPGFRHDGRQYYFRQGITFSHTGYYAPTFRLGSGSVFDTAGSTLFPRDCDLRLLLALLNSRTVRYLFKNFINHSVNTSEGPLKEIPLPKPKKFGNAISALTELVAQIILHQQEDRYYPYLQREQREIDRIVYDLYDLSADEQAEVERWHTRRYPRLFAG